jgi:hypothetical protein
MEMACPAIPHFLGFSILALVCACSAADTDRSQDRPGPNGAPSGAASGTGTNPVQPGSSAARDPSQVTSGVPVTIDGCLAQPPEQVRRLEAGGPPGSMRFLYPYADTVFPRGLAAPLVMWEGEGASADVVYVTLRSSTFSYRGCLKPSAPGRLVLPQEVWEQAAASSRGKSDPFQLAVSALEGERVAGPIRESLIIAPGSLKGSIYYNSYSSALARKGGALGGAVLRIPAGGQAELFLGQRGCTGCHGASADGTRLVTNEGVYALTPSVTVNPAPLRAAATEFVGVTPDGSAYAFQGNLYETDSGRTLSANLPASANEVSFSPDGQWATFIDGFVNTRGTVVNIQNLPVVGAIPGLGSIPGLGGTGGAPQKLATMRYDRAARSLSEYRAFQVAPGAQWPLFLPDSKALLFADTGTNDLMLLDIASGKVTLLARAMGFRTPDDAAKNVSFLPFAQAGESRQAFFPTMLPVAAGGYFWVYFDSPRRYGNFDTTKIESGLSVPAGIDLSGLGITGLPGLTSKQLWVAAIEIAADGSYITDRSAPAFYLPGQEMGANNHRAFSALDACLDQGQRCDSGTRCCSGFCANGSCVPPPTDRCAETEDACRSASDCCHRGEQCINGFCSIILL